MSSRSRAVLINTAGNIFPPVIGIVSAPLLAVALGASGRGEAAAATAPLILATSLFTIGLPEAFTYFVAKFQRIRRSTILCGYALLVVVGTIAFLGTIPLSSWLSGGNAGVAGLIVLCSAALPPTLLIAGVRGFAMGQQAWWLITLERVVSSVARLLAIIALLVLRELTPMSAALVIAISPLLGIVAYLPLWFDRRQSRPQEHDVSLVHVSRFGVAVWGGTLSGILLSRLDQVLILPLSSSAELGIYVVAVTIAEVALVFNSAVRDVSFASHSRAFDQAALTRAARVSTLITGGLCAALTVISVWLVPLIFGAEYDASVVVIAVLSLGILLGNPGSVAGAGLAAQGRPLYRSTSIAVGVVINVVALFALVPPLGALGAAVATLAGNVTAAIGNLYFSKTVYGVPALHYIGIRRGDLRFIRRAIQVRVRGGRE